MPRLWAWLWVLYATAAAADGDVFEEPAEPTLHDDGHQTYRFKYYIHDVKTGDYKTQEEIGEGGLVRGTYSVGEPNGDLRVVSYTAGRGHGFQAMVRVQPTAVPLPVPESDTSPVTTVEQSLGVAAVAGQSESDSQLERTTTKKVEDTGPLKIHLHTASASASQRRVTHVPAESERQPPQQPHFDQFRSLFPPAAPQSSNPVASCAGSHGQGALALCPPARAQSEETIGSEDTLKNHGAPVTSKREEERRQGVPPGPMWSPIGPGSPEHAAPQRGQMVPTAPQQLQQDLDVAEPDHQSEEIGPLPLVQAHTGQEQALDVPMTSPAESRTSGPANETFPDSSRLPESPAPAPFSPPQPQPLTYWPYYPVHLPHPAFFYPPTLFHFVPAPIPVPTSSAATGTGGDKKE